MSQLEFLMRSESPYSPDASARVNRFGSSLAFPIRFRDANREGDAPTEPQFSRLLPSLAVVLSLVALSACSEKESITITPNWTVGDRRTIAIEEDLELGMQIGDTTSFTATGHSECVHQRTVGNAIGGRL